MRFAVALLMLLPAAQAAAAKRVLFLTHSAGFRHDSIAAAVRSFGQIAARNGVLEIVATEDVSVINATNLQSYDAVFFFTSGELPLNNQQKRDLLEFVRGGKGFGGAHSATDTLYTWEEYGDLIGGYFDGHPWVQEVRVDVEDMAFPGLSRMGESFRIVEEIYQHRSFSRDNVRVLMTLDTRTVDLKAAGVNRTDGDFALTWCRRYGSGRVFYTALGHFDETWLDARFQQVLEGALLWLTGEVEADATPRVAATPVVGEGGVGNVAGAAVQHAPGSVVAIYGRNLTHGATMQASRVPLPDRIAGTAVLAGGRQLPLYFVSPGQVNAQLPFDLAPGKEVELNVRSVNREGDSVRLRIGEAAPALIAGARSGNTLVLYAAGLGAVQGNVPAGEAAASGSAIRTVRTPEVRVNEARADVAFSGLAPLLVGIYQVNVVLAGQSGPLDVKMTMGEVESNTLRVP
ncbi:MAG: ThuA domain-containing protein [Bryobacterales bacterium]|nr:ThuA domain-containing protein [Bryobacterales bacterium]